MDRMIIGVDPHKASVTIEVVDAEGKVAATGTFGTDARQYAVMLGYVRQWPERVWAVEGAEGAGRPLTQRLLKDGEAVRDVPAKLTARVRVLDTGQGRKTDAVDAHAVTAVALSRRGLRELSATDGDVVALRVLVDRRDELSGRRAATLNRLHRLLAELVPGGAGRHLSPTQAKAMLATVRPRDPGGAMRRRIAADLLADLFTVDAQLKAVTAELRTRVRALGSHLMDLYGMGPAGAARVVADVGDVTRFADLGPVRRVDRDRAAGRLLRGAAAAPALPGREPAPEPCPAHHGHRPGPPRHPRPCLLPAPVSAGEDPDGGPADPQTPPVRRRLPATGRRPATTPNQPSEPWRASGPGRTPGGDTRIQRGRPSHPDGRLFGSVTTRTRHHPR